MPTTGNDTLDNVGIVAAVFSAVGAAAVAIWKLVHAFFTFKTEHEALMRNMAEEETRMAMFNELRAEVASAKDERKELIEEVRALRQDIREDVSNLSDQLNKALLALATKRGE